MIGADAVAFMNRQSTIGRIDLPHAHDPNLHRRTAFVCLRRRKGSREEKAQGTVDSTFSVGKGLSFILLHRSVFLVERMESSVSDTIA